MKEAINLIGELNSPDDIKKLNIEDLDVLAMNIRDFLIEKVANTGGHLASNLGVVELTIALHRTFNTPEDKIIWDVGHQSYVHKLITGRKDCFDSLRKQDGISGFPKVKESQHDCFNTGHSSTSISAALGIAKARDIRKEKYSVIAVIGDGALTGGMSFEALNDAGRSHNNLIVVLNDNEMSIAKNVGGLSKYLSKIRTQPFYYKVKEDIDIILNKIPAIGKKTAKALDRAKGTIKYLIMPGIIFEELGFKYLGPIDGHNINELSQVLARAKEIKGPVFVHIITQKGKGYIHAEEKPHQFHGISPFEIETGEVLEGNGKSYSALFGEVMVNLAEEEEKLAAITAAMPHGTGLIEFSKKYPNRFFDVGIAEQHAVTFAAGLARNGIIPVVAIYSSFLQRAYDQIIHDVATQKLHVIFAIDRAGVVGEDGETHQGLYDLSFLSHIPNLTILVPSDFSEMERMLRYAVYENNGPIAIRYPRGRGLDKLVEYAPLLRNKGVRLCEGKDLTILAIGNMVETGLAIQKILHEKGYGIDLVNARFVKPLDKELIISSTQKTKKLLTLEDNTIIGGFGSSVLQLLNNHGINIKAKIMGYPDEFIEQGTISEIRSRYHLNPEDIANEMIGFIKSK